MNKKIIALTLCMTAILSNSAYAAYVTEKMPDENKITISGILEGATVNRLLNIAVAKKGYDMSNYPNGLLYSAVVNTDEIGSFSEEITLNMENVSDAETDFVLYLSYYDANGLYSENFTYYKASVIAEILNEIASKTSAEEVKSVIEAKLEALNINSSYYTNLSESEKLEIYDEIAEATEFLSVADFENEFYSCVLAQALDNAQSGEEVKTLLEDLRKYAQLDETPMYKEFEKLADEKQMEVYQRLFGKGTENAGEIYNVFAENTFCIAMGETKNQAEVESLVANGGDITALIYQTIEKSKYPGNIYIEFVGKSLVSLDDFEAEVNNLIIEQNKTNNNYSGGGPGSSSAGSSGSGYIPSGGVGKSANAVVESENENTEIFSDIHEAEWAREKVMNLYDKNIISGYPDGTFRPNKSITREEFISLITAAFSLPQSDEERFEDVEKGAWYEKSVNAAAAAGLVSGIDENCFGIGRNITRQEAAAILERTAEKLGIKLSEDAEVNFTDYEHISDYARQAVETLSKAGVISGYPDGTFRPNEIVTRAQCCVMLGILTEKGESNA